ncbi:SulP family inorganic anion transporter [bacterium]|nr:SulP family inorganic anion transporter [bacterium]
MKWTEQLSRDVPAGLVVYLVALPLCLGIALASGAPSMAGIISGVVGGLVVGALSGSPLSVSGPAAGLTVIVFTAIEELGSFPLFLSAVLLAGVIQFGLGWFKTGFVSAYFPVSVIRGMLAAIGLILILKQIPHLAGVDSDAFGEFEFHQHNGFTTFSFLEFALTHVHPGALVLGLGSVVFLWVWERPFMQRWKLFSLVPAALVVVVLGIVVNEWWFAQHSAWYLTEEHRVQLPLSGNGGGGWERFFTMPEWSGLFRAPVWKTAVTLAIVASIETLLSLEAIDKLDPLRRVSPANQELKAQGIGNIVNGLIGGLPVTSVIVRSSANVTAGGLTKTSTMVHGFLLLITVVAVPGLLNRIPYAVLAALLLRVGYKLTTPAIFLRKWKLGKDQFIPFLTTIVAIVLTDLLIGIAIGMAVGVFFVLKAHHAEGFVLDSTIDDEGRAVLRIELNHHVSFINKAELTKTLYAAPLGSQIQIDGHRSVSVDYDVLELIHSFKANARDRRIDYQLRAVPELPVAPQVGH